MYATLKKITRRLGIRPGATLHNLRQRFGKGLAVAYYRDRVRPKILQTAPMPGTNGESCEVHVLTSTHDWLNLLWVLKSLYHSTDKRFALCIHEDGSLTEEELSLLKLHFPDARVIDRKTADAKLDRELADHPRCRSFRSSNPLALKVFDFASFLEADRMFLLDSDILFFSEPSELIERLETPEYRLNTLNKDWRYGYSATPEALRENLDFAVPDCINSGLGLIHRESCRLDLVESFLGLPGILSHHHRIEQTLISLTSAKYGFEFLPAEYDVHMERHVSSEVCRHYTGPIRHFMYRDGLKRLAKRDWVAAGA